MTDNYWHTGEPTEQGTYLVSDLMGDYAISYFDGKKFGYVKFPDEEPIKYWHKIPKYKE